MARNKNDRHVVDNIVPAFSSTPPQIQITKDGFPTGDEGILALCLNYFGTFTVVTPGGSPVSGGGAKILRALTVETDKHKKIIDAVDGLGLLRMLQFEGKAMPQTTDCASNASGTTFGASLRIPFADVKRLVRPYDLMLDMGKAPRLQVKRQYGVVTDVQSAGTTPSVSSIREDINVEVLPGPLNDGSPARNPGVANPEDYSELPGFMMLKERDARPVTSTGTLKIPIPMGDRIIRRIYISQQTIAAANGLVTEVATIIGRNAGISFKIGKDVIIDRLTFAELQEKNKTKFALETLPTGWAVIDFDESMRWKDFLDCYKYPSGIAANLEIEVTTATDAHVVVYTDSMQLLPEAADRTK